jgi:hypothetical protein
LRVEYFGSTPVVPNPSPVGSGSPPTGAFLKVEPDPNITTGNEVNSFIKNIVRNGNKKVAATGGWWGPVDQFYKNQSWVVSKSVGVGNVFAPGSPIQVSFACLLPGYGTQRNTMGLPLMRYQIGHNESNYIRNAPLKTFVNSTLNAEQSGSQELRQVCITKEGSTGTFGDGTPIVGEELHVNIDPSVWFGAKGTPGIGLGNHLNLPAKYDLLDVHSWYSNIEYVYGSVDGASDSLNGPMSTQDLIGATVKGVLTVNGFAFKRTNELTAPIHHVELRIEQDDEDYTVQKDLNPPNGDAIVAQKKRFSYSLDTTKVSDGWHILSWHVHAINHGVTGSKVGHQLAGEIKIPICVNNTGSGNCF